jgi:hypothetical protein
MDINQFIVPAIAISLIIVIGVGLYYIKTTSDLTQVVLKKQEVVEKNILGNLTAHRIVANATRDHILQLENETNVLLKGLKTNG